MCSSIIRCAVLIFNSQARNTALRPSVPSEEMYNSSVVIPATHLPQDQVSTSGGSARNSRLSQGRVSLTSWHSCDEPDDLSTARRFEMPEVKIKS
jgi:hypothetical protein